VDMIVVDANILIRAVLGRRVWQLIETYSAKGVRFFAPDAAFEDARKYLPLLLRKHSIADTTISASIDYLEQMIEPVEREVFGVFEKAARERLRGRDEDDWPVLAVAMGLACPIWTEDTDFFGTGIAIWTTSRIEIFLQAQVKA